MTKGEKRKQELIEIAYKLFISKGYENTSIDEIIHEAGIAKGTYYYYFESKEATLEEVINYLLSNEIVKAKEVLASDMPTLQKLFTFLTCFQVRGDETGLIDTLNLPENIILHEKMSEKLILEATPLLSEVVKEGIEEGLFKCERIESRVKLLLTLSNKVFDDSEYSEDDMLVFIELVEKALGAKEGTMSFIADLIGQ